MGILVPEAAIPMGLTLSNVYISFTGEQVYVQPVRGSNVFIINSAYRIYKDISKQPDTNIRIAIQAETSNISIGVYTILYEKLKLLYPNSTDIIDTPLSKRPDGMSEEQYTHWIDLINNVSLYISQNPGHNDLEDLYNAVENSFTVLRSSDTTNLEQLETLYNSLT